MAYAMSPEDRRGDEAQFGHECIELGQRRATGRAVGNAVAPARDALREQAIPRKAANGRRDLGGTLFLSDTASMLGRVGHEGRCEIFFDHGESMR